jgi:hypothetical protein
VDAILYVRAGCAWRQLPADFPPWQTVYWYFNQWEQARATEKILPVVRAQLRVQEGRNPEPSAGLIDSQSVKGADTRRTGLAWGRSQSTRLVGLSPAVAANAPSSGRFRIKIDKSGAELRGRSRQPRMMGVLVPVVADDTVDLPTVAAVPLTVGRTALDRLSGPLDVVPSVPIV